MLEKDLWKKENLTIGEIKRGEEINKPVRWGNIHPLLIFPVVPWEWKDTYCTQKRQPRGITLYKRSIHKCQKQLRQLVNYFWNTTPLRLKSITNRESTLKSTPEARLNCFLKLNKRQWKCIFGLCPARWKCNLSIHCAQLIQRCRTTGLREGRVLSGQRKWVKARWGG